MYENLREQITKAAQDNKATVLRQAIPVEILPDWIEFLNCLNASAKDDDPDYFNPDFVKAGKKLVGLIHFWGEFNLVTSKTKGFFKNMPQYKELVTSIYDGVCTDITMVLSVTDWDKSSTRHHDDADVMNLQCLGKTKWLVAPAYEGPDEEFILDPGDIIYVPKRLWHEVSAIGPRTNLIFGYEPNKLIDGNETFSDQLF